MAFNQTMYQSIINKNQKRSFIGNPNSMPIFSTPSKASNSLSFHLILTCCLSLFTHIGVIQGIYINFHEFSISNKAFENLIIQASKDIHL
jgi:hypothetical protein